MGRVLRYLFAKYASFQFMHFYYKLHHGKLWHIGVKKTGMCVCVKVQACFSLSELLPKLVNEYTDNSYCSHMLHNFCSLYIPCSPQSKQTTKFRSSDIATYTMITSRERVLNGKKFNFYLNICPCHFKLVAINGQNANNGVFLMTQSNYAYLGHT